MARTKPLNSKTNIKQSTSGDMPLNPVGFITKRDRQTSTLGQTVINITTFSVDMNNKDAFLLIINGRVMDEGASNDYTFTNIQSNNTSSQITLTQSLPAGFPIVTILAGVVVQQEPNVNSLQAQINNLGGSAPGLVNLIALDSAYSISKQQNSDAEKGIGDWISYANAANIAPTDMSSGVANTTITRDTAGTINGVASFLMTVNTGATRQGEGVACTAYIPPAYRGRTLTFSFPFTLTGTVVDGDFSLYAYDVTNAQVITPYQANKILGASGQALCTFPVASNCTQIKVGIHVARATNNGAVAIRFDDVKLSPDVPALGMAGSDWQSYSISYDNVGTPSQNSASGARTGDRLKITGQFVPGSVPSATFAINLPNNLSIDISKFGNSPKKVGTIRRIFDSNAFPSTSQGPWDLWVDPAVPAKIFGNAAASSGNYAKQNSDNYSTTNVTVYEFEVPIAGWSSNVSMAQSSTYRISSYLANGTRVTGTAPTALGQYRSYVRSANTTSTLTDTAPATAPTATDGIKIWGTAAYTSSDTANNPSSYDIFIGKNKFWRIEAFTSAGKSTPIDITGRANTTTSTLGYLFQYDANAGILSLRPQLNGSTANHTCGFDSGYGAPSSCYFDIIVSDNALAVGIAAPRSEVYVYSGNGYGSTNTMIRRFSTVGKNQGTAITYADSATVGASFTINEDGLYSISYSEQYSVGDHFGVSANSTQLTTAINNINAADRILHATTPQANYTGRVSDSMQLTAGTVIRPHTTGQAAGTSMSLISFRITKVSN